MKTGDLLSINELNKVNAYKFYTQQDFPVYKEDAKGNLITIKCIRYKLPQLIVRQWLSILLAEEPIIENIKGTDDKRAENVENPIDLNIVMHDVLAYGNTFIVPLLFENKIIFKLINEYAADDLEFIEQLDKLIYLKYTEQDEMYNPELDKKIERTLTHIHYYDEDAGKYIYTVKHNDTLIREVDYSIDGILPWRQNNKAYGSYGKAIFNDAIPYIIDFDEISFDDKTDRELSQPLLLIPDTMVKSELTIDEDGKPKVEDEYLGSKRLIRIMPSEEDSELKPIEWRGNWSPDPYIASKDNVLHMISLFSGFGSRYFSFSKDGGLKTATEVVSDKDDLYKNKMLLDEVMREIIYKALYAQDILLEQEPLPEDSINIRFSDSIITDDKAKQEGYYKDFIADGLSQEEYLKLRNYDQDIINASVENKTTEDSDNQFRME